MRTAKDWARLIDGTMAASTEQVIRAAQRDALQYAASICVAKEPHGGISDWDYADGNTQSMIRDRLYKIADTLL